MKSYLVMLLFLAVNKLMSLIEALDRAPLVSEDFQIPVYPQDVAH